MAIMKEPLDETRIKKLEKRLEETEAEIKSVRSDLSLLASLITNIDTYLSENDKTAING